MMRLTHWLLGIVLGTFAGGSALEAGVLAVLVVVPSLVWAGREPRRPLGLAGFLVGVGIAVGGLLALANARCAADPSCSMPVDPTPYFVFALALLAGGASLTVLGSRRASRSAN